MGAFLCLFGRFLHFSFIIFLSFIKKSYLCTRHSMPLVEEAVKERVIFIGEIVSCDALLLALLNVGNSKTT